MCPTEMKKKVFVLAGPGEPDSKLFWPELGWFPASL